MVYGGPTSDPFSLSTFSLLYISPFSIAPDYGFLVCFENYLGV